MDLCVLFPLLAQWPAPARERLLQQGCERVFVADSEVCLPGQPVEEILFVCHGLMAAYAPGKRPARPFNYGYIVPGNIIGLHSLLSSRSYGVAIHALRDTRCFALPLPALVDALNAYPLNWRAIAAELSLAVHQLLDFVSMLAEPNGYSRLKHVLENLEAYAQSKPGAPGQTLTQRELGERIGLSREMVNRMLRELRTGGYIGDDDAGGIRILKPLPARF